MNVAAKKHRLSLRMAQTGGIRTLYFAGHIDETFDRSRCDEALLDLGDAALELDTQGISQVNSVGVMQWIRFIQALSQGRRVAYVRCSTAFLMQLDMVPMLRPAGLRVASVVVSFECTPCRQVTDILAESGKAYGKGKRLAVSRPTCVGCLELMQNMLHDDADLTWLE